MHFLLIKEMTSECGCSVYLIFFPNPNMLKGDQKTMTNLHFTFLQFTLKFKKLIFLI